LEWVKINVDGALDFRQGNAGAGMVARNNQGRVLSGCCRKYGHIRDPFTIELVACRDAMVLAKNRGYNRVIVETDCQVVVTMWDKDLANKSIGCNLIEEMKEMAVGFQGFKLLYAKRESNHVAHLCAREALSLNSVVLNFDVIPGFLAEAVRSEVVSPD
jgi:ribonuclease HI